MRRTLTASFVFSMGGITVFALLLLTPLVDPVYWEWAVMAVSAVLFLASALLGACFYVAVFRQRRSSETPTGEFAELKRPRLKWALRIAWAISIPVLGIMWLGSGLGEASLLSGFCAATLYLTAGVLVSSFFVRPTKTPPTAKPATGTA